jgi:hypothetical protein
MGKIVLLIIFSISLGFPQYGKDTIAVSKSVLLRAKEEGISVLLFDKGRSIKIIDDSANVEVFDKEKEKLTEKGSDFSAARPYGVTPSGDYFLAKSLAKKFGDSIPQVSCAPYWGRHKMAEFGSFYVYRSGKKITESQAYCFFVYGRKLPGALSTISQKMPDNFKVNWEEIVSDNNGGSYFYSAPAEPR